MNKSLRHQSGSAHIVILIILVAAIIGSLGFVFWQNFLQPTITPQVATNAQKEEELSPEGIKNKFYSNTEYSFKYPKVGWRVEETVADSNIITPTVYSDNYAQRGMGLDAGAAVGVYATSTTKTFDEEYVAIKESEETFGLKDIKKITINGEEAFSYNSEFEGPRYHTVFIKNGMRYDIVYQYAYTDDPSIHMDAYELIVSSFSFAE